MKPNISLDLFDRGTVERKSMADRFVIRKTADGKYRGIFKSGDTRLFASPPMATKAEVEAAIELFKAKGAKARVRDKSA